MKVIILIFVLIVGTDCFANPVLPYTNRFRDYSGWSGGVRGDIRTIGMAGALVGLGDSWAGATYNPAGLAMTLDYTGAQLNSNRIRDGYIQDEDQEVRSSNFGIFGSVYPWGFALGHWSPQKVGARYQLLNGGALVNNQIAVDEFRISLARLFFQDKLSIGGNLIFGRGRAEIGFLGNSELRSKEAITSFGGSLGVLYKFKNRFLIRINYSFPVDYGLSGRDPNSPGLTNFFQNIKTPEIIGVGFGWVPNQIFRIGLSLQRISATPGVALFSDQERLVGEVATYQPSVGIDYRWADFPNFLGKLNIGSYLESARLSGIGPRPHWTGAIEANPYIANLGLAFDIGPKYRNVIFSFGIDGLRALRWLNVIPPARPRSFGRWFANPFLSSEAGLPRAMVENWDGTGSTPSELIEIGKKIPKKLGKKVGSTIKGIQQIFKGEDLEKQRKEKNEKKEQ